MSVKISELTNTPNPITGAELVEVVQAGLSHKTTVDDILSPLANDSDPAKGASLIGYSGDQLPASLRRLIGVADPSKAAFAARLELAAHQGQKVVWVGDSITEQGKDGTGNGIGFTTYLQNKFQGATYVNEGIGGNTTLNIIARMPSLVAHAADLYVVAIGVNDVRYNDSRGATNVSAYITNIQSIYNSLSAVGDVMFIGIWPTFWKDQFAALLRKATDDRMNQYNNALRDFCTDNSLPFSNPNNAIRSVIDFANVGALIPDGVHPDYTATAGKRMYADAVLRDSLNREDYSQNYHTNGKVFFKFVFGRNDKPDGFCGIKNITINGTSFQEAFGDTANLDFPFHIDLFGSYKPAFAGYYNKANDFPLYATVGCDAWPASILVSGVVTSAAGNRGLRQFETWFSTDPRSVTDINHPSWVLFEKVSDNNGAALNILPRNKSRFYYQLRLTSTGTVDLKRIGTNPPIRVATQNVVSTSQQRFDLLFGAGIVSAGDALSVVAPNGVVMWESDGEENSIALESFSSTLAAFTLYQSTDPNALSSVIHESWVPVVVGSGDGTYSVPRIQPAAPQSDSAAADVAALRDDLNALMAKLRAVGIMRS